MDLNYLSYDLHTSWFPTLKSSLFAWSISSCYLAQVLLLPPLIPRYPFSCDSILLPLPFWPKQKAPYILCCHGASKIHSESIRGWCKTIEGVVIGMCKTFYYLPTTLILFNPIHQSIEEWKYIGCKSSKMLGWVWWPSRWWLGMLGIQGTNVQGFELEVGLVWL